MSNPKHKNGTNSKPRQPTARQHLLTKIIKNHHQQPKLSESVQCKYGIFCAHLRSEGKCLFPHRRNHFHFLNLVAPNDCLEDEDQEGKILSKRQKKQKKIIEKTINTQIDVAALDHKEKLLKNKADAQAKKQLIGMLEETEKKVIELVQSTSASEFFERLNGVGKEEVYEIKRKAMIQIKKKKQDLFNQIIDKEYRIANRLIKASKKNKDETLDELYKSINHDTIPSIRQYFDRYFVQSSGIPQQKPQKTLFQTTSTLYLQNLHSKVFFLEPEEYIHQYYFLKSQESPPISLMANTAFYNMLVPFKMYKQMAYNKYLFLNCDENLTFNRLSNFLSKEYVETFYGKMKAPPEFSFGQGEQNMQKFVNWANKIFLKFKESKAVFKVVLLLSNIESLFPEGKLQQFESEKLKERQHALLSLVEVFNPSIIFILKEITAKIKQNIGEVLSIDANSLGENMLKM